MTKKSFRGSLGLLGATYTCSIYSEPLLASVERDPGESPEWTDEQLVEAASAWRKHVSPQDGAASPRHEDVFFQAGDMRGKLDSLIGLHSLDAVDVGSFVKVKQYEWSEEADCNTISFRIDGKVYTAIEDPNDGYRSMLDRLVADDREMMNVFTPIQVLAKKKASRVGCANDTLEFIDVVTGGVVLEVGTDNYDDYYPMFVGTFTPENMATNAAKASDEAGR